MKTRTVFMKTPTLILIAAVLAVAVAFGQWAWVMNGDGFAWGRDRVFTYGLPFMIIDCPSELAMRTPSWQVPFRFFGNVVAAFLFFMGVEGFGLAVSRWRSIHRA